ncbi:MAG: DUF2878 domain-containing protein [Gammaproteobacteria bacterium]|nr:DUF2878 domain-containing protein [Gammaproteobacteria bacterium]
MKSSLRNFVLFQISWFACAIGIGNDIPALSYLVVGSVIVIHLYLSNYRQRDALYLLMVGILGTLVDSALGWFGILSFSNQWFCPPWLTGLWMALASTMHYSLSWLNRRLLLSSIFGAIGGPASYYAGMKFGALQLGSNTLYCLFILAFIWSLIVPFMVQLAFPWNPVSRAR